MRRDYLRGHLDGLLLAVLSDEPGHGYALTQRLHHLSGAEFTVPEGSLYPALQRLERAGLVTSGWDATAGRRRRVYRLTSAGRREVRAVARDWETFSTAVTRVLDARGGFA